ncbi:MAG: hypothetical protein IPM84_27845 [Anaerolineae bacterium]|nr:hypothetical protein [Anaerolineae bacterium]
MTKQNCSGGQQRLGIGGTIPASRANCAGLGKRSIAVAVVTRNLIGWRTNWQHRPRKR